MIGAVTRWCPEPFTAEQWEELQQQALIYKYMVFGVPVPPHLIFSLECSFAQRSSSSSSLTPIFPRQPRDCYEFQYEAKGGGRKIDREPWRCRRTDGKKWRCSREAYPDSKYCERHLHRGRHRSRKPVESLTTTIAPISTHSHHKSHPGFLHHHHQSSSMYTPSVLSLSSFNMYPNCNSPMPSASFAPQTKHDYDRYKPQGSREGRGEDEKGFLHFKESVITARSVIHEEDDKDNPYRASPKMTSSSSHHYSQFNFQNLTDKLKEHRQEEEEEGRTRGQCFVIGTDIKTQGSIKPFHHFFSDSEWLNSSDHQSAKTHEYASMSPTQDRLQQKSQPN